MKSHRSMRTRTAARPESSRQVPGGARQQRWQSSSWYNAIDQERAEKSARFLLPVCPTQGIRVFFMYDTQNGYNTCGLIARIAHTSNALSDAENDKEVERAIEEIIFYDPTSNYVRLVKDIN